MRGWHARFDTGLAGGVALCVWVAVAAAGHQRQAAAAAPHPAQPLQRAVRLPRVVLHLEMQEKLDGQLQSGCCSFHSAD